MIEEVRVLSVRIGKACACQRLGVPRATFYRRMGVAPTRRIHSKRPSHRALTVAERQEVLGVLHAPQYVDRAPREIYAMLLDARRYLCSPRTMYRILWENREVRERRDQLRHPEYRKPELLATGPNQVWSWDLTKLRSVEKWVYYYLYVVLDIYSRFVVGWMLAHRESGDLARRLFSETCARHGVNPRCLTVHADRGSAPTAKTLSQFLADLGVTQSFSRPHVSNDNPFSESQFKTMKYHPDFPDRFTGYEHAKDFCGPYLRWYNFEHRHSGLAYLTPAMVHHGEGRRIISARQEILDQAYARNPERFVRGRPTHAALPEAVWINPPENKSEVDLVAA